LNNQMPGKLTEKNLQTFMTKH